MTDYRPITEEELKEMERELTAPHGLYREDSGGEDMRRLIAEVRRLQGTEDQCCVHGCDGVEPVPGCPHPHRHFKDGRWLDDGSEM